MKIRRLEIRQYRGIEELDVDVPPAGAVVAGANGKGKTSVLKAIRAALAGVDVGPDAIRNGAERAEIFVDLDHVTVRRVLTKANSRVVVRSVEGVEQKRPQTLLTELLGNAPLDPLDLFLAPAKDRRALVLAALPVHVTLGQLRKWVPDLPETYDVSGHGLDVVARLHREKYDERKAANSSAKRAEEEFFALHKAANEAEAAAPSDAPPPAEAEEGLRLAMARQQALENEVGAAKAREQTYAERSGKIAALRVQAAITRDAIQAESDGGLDAVAMINRRRGLIADLIAQSEAAQREVATLHALIATMAVDKVNRESQIGRLERVLAQEEQAKALEETLGDLPTAPDQAKHDEARRGVDRARDLYAYAHAAERARVERRKADAAKVAREEAERAAEALDRIVVKLANDAPRALLAETDAIPGLGLDGDGITLDGVRLESLCGAEQMKFAIEIARRANAKSKILVCDGLERIDPETRAEFIRHAVRNGYQMIGTRVESGEVVTEAIEEE